LPTTPIGSAPYPAPTGADAVPADLMALANWASTRVVMHFADAAARDAALTSPTQGMLCWLDTPGSLTVRTASAWKTVYAPLAFSDIALNNGFSLYGTTPQASVDGGNFVVLKGGVTKTASGVQIVTGDVLGSVPSSLGTPIGGDYPIATQYLSAASARVYVGADHNITYYGPNTGWLSLNGVRVPLS
jgi:hypothetical protein